MKSTKLQALVDRMPTRLSKAGWWYLGATTLTSMAAYQSGSNVLFLALAFFLSALLLNGLISWWNFSRIEFQQLRCSRTHALETGWIHLEQRDLKRALPSLGLKAVFEIKSVHAAHAIRVRHALPLGASPPGQWSLHTLPWTPTDRGWHHIRLCQIESAFPFGLLLKIFPQSLNHETIVWPAIRTATLPPVATPASRSQGEDRPHIQRLQQGMASSEIAGLRSYQHGDPMRKIHWRKSAQLRRPTVIIQPDDSTPEPALLRFDFHASHFPSELELHTYCSQIAGWIEAQRHQGIDLNIALHDQPPFRIHNPSSLHRSLDALALIPAQTHALPQGLLSQTSGQTVITPTQLQAVT